MDTETYHTLNRIEAKIDHATNGIRAVLNYDTYIGIVEFLETEVYDKDGRLHHLRNDEKLQAIFDELQERLETTEEEPNKETPASTPARTSTGEYRQHTNTDEN